MPAADPARPSLEGKWPAYLAFTKTLSRHLNCLTVEGNTVSTGDPEQLHRIRTALRRVQTDLILFGPCVAEPVRKPYVDEVRRIGRILGEARDWDVFVENVLPEFLLSQRRAPWFALLQRRAGARRAAAYAAAEIELAGHTLETLMASLSQWTEAKFGEPGIQVDPDDSIDDRAPKLLAKMHRKLSRRSRHIDRKSLIRLHAIRKTLKKMRYASESLCNLFPRKTSKAFIKSAKKLEKRFGRLNDAATARRQLAVLGIDGGMDMLPGVAAMDAWCQERVNGDIAALKPAWRRFCDAPLFWG